MVYSVLVGQEFNMSVSKPDLLTYCSRKFFKTIIHGVYCPSAESGQVAFHLTYDRRNPKDPACTLN